MPEVNIFWDPQGITLDSLGSQRFLHATDGDTPYISVSIRMLSVDAPEVHYPGTRRPSKADEELAQLADWMAAGHAPIDDGLAAYLHPRLATGTAGTLHEQQGEQGKAVFQQMLDKMLTRTTGSRRNLFIRTADEKFDQYGRILAYIAPSYTEEERVQLSVWERATFNLLMVRSGWGASFIIYPSIPKYDDLVMFHQSAKEAYLSGRGIWTEPLLLIAYEFRMMIKLYDITRRLLAGEKLKSYQRKAWIERYCADMTTRAIYFPEQYYRVAPYNRLFVWPKDVAEAVASLNLVPGD